MKYDVKYTEKALRELKKLDKSVAQKIVHSISELKDEPYSNIKKLKGTGNQPLYSHRVGNYRVILTIQNNQMIIFVLEVGDRKNIYRKYRS